MDDQDRKEGAASGATVLRLIWIAALTALIGWWVWKLLTEHSTWAVLAMRLVGVALALVALADALGFARRIFDGTPGEALRHLRGRGKQ